MVLSIQRGELNENSNFRLVVIGDLDVFPVSERRMEIVIDWESLMIDVKAVSGGGLGVIGDAGKEDEVGGESMMSSKIWKNGEVENAENQNCCISLFSEFST